MFYKIDTVYMTLVKIWYEILKVTGYLPSEALVQNMFCKKRWKVEARESATIGSSIALESESSILHCVHSA